MEVVDFTDELEKTTRIINECFDKYDLEDVFLSFNGGKDCTVLLDITINVLKSRLNTDDDVKKLKVYYIRPENPFPELEKFIFHSEKKYKLNMILINGSIKEALERIMIEKTNIKACLMGTRRTDPYCQHLDFFQMTDQGWPKVMRVSPLLNWSYHQIWSYLLQKKVSYCELYDIGFTSIGNINNTIPNPALEDSTNGRVTYKPAYLLHDGALERNGRVKNLTNGKL